MNRRQAFERKLPQAYNMPPELKAESDAPRLSSKDMWVAQITSHASSLPRPLPRVASSLARISVDSSYLASASLVLRSLQALRRTL
jgi:hypothetical protein